MCGGDRSKCDRRCVPYSVVVDFCFVFVLFMFFFNDTATTEIYTLSLHDALPIYDRIGGL